MPGATDSHVSKYSIVMMSLIERINNNEFAPGYKLPSENELIKEYNVSRITVRRALNEMETQKYIYRKQGKGTFVNRNRVNESVYRRYNQGFSAMIKSAGRVCTIRQLQKDFRPAGSFSGQLELDPREDCLYYSRIYFADGIPLLYVESYINHHNMVGVENFDYSFISLSALIRQVYGGTVYRKNRAIQSTKAGEAAPYLEVEESDPVLRLTYLSNVHDNAALRPFECAVAYARTDIIPIDAEYL